MRLSACHKGEHCLIPAKPWDTKEGFCFSSFQVEAVGCGAWIIWILCYLQCTSTAPICTAGLLSLPLSELTALLWGFTVNSTAPVRGGWKKRGEGIFHKRKLKICSVSIWKRLPLHHLLLMFFFPPDATQTCHWEQKNMLFPETG